MPLTSKIARVHCITYDIENGMSHLEQVKMLLDAGADWIQLRIKNKPTSYIAEMATVLVPVCNRYNARLIINDNVEAAQKSEAHGVHLGLGDMSVQKAREFLGQDAIIGGTANTISDIEQRVREGVDYIGVGPFRFTQTKKNLSPIVEKQSWSSLVKAAQGVPVIAIGGLNVNDVQFLKESGVWGVAVSSLLYQNESLKETLKELQIATGE
jgi:thiamine-phosphate pyrophosphorylase